MSQDYGRAVRMARAWAGVTQAELAQRVGVRAETVSSWENGKTEPSGRMLGLTAHECGLGLAVFFMWADGELLP